MARCDCDHPAPPPHQQRQRQVLWAVLGINVLIFLGEFGSGWWGHSTALQGDSLDSLGDAIVYGVSLIVVGGSLRARAGAALLKGVVQLAFAGIVLAGIVHKWIAGPVPITTIMAWAAGLTLVANGVCLLLLSPFRAHDLNMRSVWLCSRNDLVGNVAVLVAAALIALTQWFWLDWLLGGAVALLFAATGLRIVTAARRDLRGASSDVV